MSQARHVGKVVLTMPRRLDPEGTVLITGGTGALGGVAGPAPGRRSTACGIWCCSAAGAGGAGRGRAARPSWPGWAPQVTSWRATWPTGTRWPRCSPERPADAVVHAAGVLDDGVSPVADPRAAVDTVLRAEGRRGLAPARADPRPRPGGVRAVLLGRRRARHAGQANYAAANAFLDALAAHRRRAACPAVSLAWGLWAATSGMTGHLGDADLRPDGPRRRAAALSAEQGLALFDAALGARRGRSVPVRLDLAGRVRAAAGAAAARARWSAARRARRPPRRGRRRRPERPARSGSPRSAASRTDRRSARPGPRPGRRRARAPAGGRDRRRAGLQRAGLRLADRGRAAQPAQRRDRAAPARHAGLRLPDPGRAGRAPARRAGAGVAAVRRRTQLPRRAGCRSAGSAIAGRAGRAGRTRRTEATAAEQRPAKRRPSCSNRGRRHAPSSVDDLTRSSTVDTDGRHP